MSAVLHETVSIRAHGQKVNCSVQLRSVPQLLKPRAWTFVSVIGKKIVTGHGASKRAAKAGAIKACRRTARSGR